MPPETDPRFRVLLLGPQPKDQDPVAGPALAFGRLVARFVQSGTFGVDVADAARRAPGGDFLRRWLDALGWKARLAWRVLGSGQRCDVAFFHARSSDVLDGGAWVWAAAAVCGMPLVVSVAGGDLEGALRRLPPWRRALCDRTALRAPLLLLQTRALCASFGTRPGARWMPPTRDMCGLPPVPRKYCRHFLFLSALRPERGVAEALAASDRLPAGCRLTVAGPAAAGFDPALIARHANAAWLGAVEPGDVANVMRAHDALVLPSWDESDGLPGVVVEAAQCGLPVIAARAGAIEEIVEHGVNGLLVHSRSADDLARAMLELAGDRALFARLAAAALAGGERFRAPRWHAELEDWLFQLCDQGTLSRTLPFYERRADAQRRTA